MKQETLKKIVELAENFAYDDSMKIFHLPENSLATFVWYKEIDHWNMYPLLLRRAVEGWNRKSNPYTIDILAENVEFFGEGDFRIINNYFNYPATDCLTPQEQAIETCLIELLET